MLTALELAQQKMREIEGLFVGSSGSYEFDQAELYAAVAQAESLERIASILERIVSWDANQEAGNVRVDTGAL